MDHNGIAHGLPEAQGLYDPRNERDACGIGFVVNIKGQRSHDIILKGIQILINLTHRGACGCDPETGDGAGILIQIPHEFFVKECAKIGFSLPSAGEYPSSTPAGRESPTGSESCPGARTTIRTSPLSPRSSGTSTKLLSAASSRNTAGGVALGESGFSVTLAAMRGGSSPANASITAYVQPVRKIVTSTAAATLNRRSPPGEKPARSRRRSNDFRPVRASVTPDRSFHHSCRE